MMPLKILLVQRYCLSQREKNAVRSFVHFLSKYLAKKIERSQNVRESPDMKSKNTLESFGTHRNIEEVPYLLLAY